MKTQPSQRCVILCLHDDWWFVRQSIGAAFPFGPTLAFISRLSWNGSTGDWEKVADEATKAGAEVILGDWDNETDHRRFAMQEAINRGYKYALIPDGDEVIEPSLLDKLTKIADTCVADRVHAFMDTYWKSARYVIRPKEQLTPAILLNLQVVNHVYIRDYQGGSTITLGPEHGVIHHLSYAGPDERIQRKISTWSHKHELVHDWYRKIWLGWDHDKLMRNLHPTHPQAYGMAERIEIPEILRGIWDERPFANTNPQKPLKWPKVSVVIPLHGGEDEIRLCLQSLEKCKDLIHETIVVDDVSPDNAGQIAESFDVTLLKNETNLGFGKTCNRGVEASSGDVIFFLNSDTIVPRFGLIRLIEGLMESGSIGASGPMSNNVGYHQRISPTYTTLDTLELFAADLAETEEAGRDVEILVGFALAIRKSVLDEVGLFDERFGRGLFEDTDLCYRLARAGYRLRMITGAYVHHWGSRTLTRAIPDVSKLLDQNGVLFRNKWSEDIESGFASHLPGFNLSNGLVRFNESRRPYVLFKAFEKLKDQARISLCMIVKNEERVLANCLKSALPYFFEIIVVDTGSTDRTKEIAKEFGVKLIESTWPDSFSIARNESLSHATGDWIFWMDADDVLPIWSGERVLHAAIDAPSNVTAFFVSVQFVEDGPGAGTKVDHVKLIRNFPGIKFEMRVHEQILGSVRKHGGDILWLDAVVLHSGYDTSPEGQARKRVREWHLLDLDLAENPEHPFVWFNIGMTHHHTAGHHEEAVHALRECIRFSGDQDSHIRKAYAMLGVSLRELGRIDEAVQAFEEGLAKVGQDPELLYNLAIVLTAQGNYQNALTIYEEMPTEIGKYISSVDIGIVSFKRLQNMGAVKFSLGDYWSAKKDWEAAFALNPRSTFSLLALFDAALSMGDFKSAHWSLENLLAIQGHSLEWAERRSKLAQVSEEPGGSVGAMTFFVNSYPQAVGPRLVLTRILLAENRVNEAIPHLHILDSQSVAEAAFMLGISHLQRNDIEGAIWWTKRSVELNPGHAQSIQQLEKLHTLIDVDIPSVLNSEEQRELLIGPDAGNLQIATKRHTVVIVTYNSEAWITKCLDSVLPTLSESDQVIVVDNASKDKTVKVVKSLKNKGVKVIASKVNLGYAKAANEGIRASHGEYVTLLNPDTEVSPGWLEGLASKLIDGVGAVGPVSDNIGGTQFVGHYIKPGVAISDIPNAVKTEYEGKTLDTKLIMGMCFMSPRKVFNEVGLLDENLFLGADDLEFSWRLKSLGFKLAVVLDVFVHHAGQKSFATRERSEVTELIAASDVALIRKLARYYGPQLPTSYNLWACDIFDSALARFSVL